MRLVVTGGGTGGHVYPALEVARAAAGRGIEILYLGSIRGQEGKLCEERGLLFKGFGSEPLYSLKTARGWRSLSRILRARARVKKHLIAARPDVVFSTGGYSAAPVVAAARALRIPYVIHESNSIPGRTNRMFGRGAKSFLTVFHATERLYRDRPVVRTGQPIRSELREAAASRGDLLNVALANALVEGEVGPGVFPNSGAIMVLGGSQGAAYLNMAVPSAIAEIDPDAEVIHVAGPTQYAETTARIKALNLPNYHVEPYLETDRIAQAYADSEIVIGRSGGALAEFALFGLPSVLVPLPTSADDHQRRNAEEFEGMGAALIAEQEPAPYPKLAEAIQRWRSGAMDRRQAVESLRGWNVPDATDRIVAKIVEAAE